MSVQYGRWDFEGQSLGPELEKVSTLLAPYGPDGNGTYSKGGVRILYRAFHTTKESHRETQPNISPTGTVVTWDGRLDSRTELIRELPGLNTNCTDTEIVAAAFEKWGTKCFAKFIGDWALSIWNPIQRSLTLAKDPIGTRHLYYSIDDNRVTWCSILDPLILFAGKTFEICEEYVAGWIACFPAEHLTPYVGIHAVKSSSFVLIRPGKHTISKYWDFDPSKRIRYRTDAEYEDHFRTVLSTAVQRRLRSDRPVLAELSGGMDSSAIVCIADIVIARGEAETPRLDTISYYDRSDRGWDELAYLTKVEGKRGHPGYHIDFSVKEQIAKNEIRSQKLFSTEFESGRLTATPDFDRVLWSEIFDPYARHMKSQQYRVTLSGSAGEDPTGGYVPTPTLELQNLLARARFCTFARQLDAWAAKTGKARLYLLWQAVRGFFSRSVTFPWAPGGNDAPPWFQPSFVRRNKAAFSWYPTRLGLIGALPSFQSQIHLLNHQRRFLALRSLCPEFLREIRYPYLDRDLLEFACAIPREQMVGVGKRRFLMKRALLGIVPNELLNRKRRASAMGGAENEISTEWPGLTEMGNHVVSSSLGIVEPQCFLGALQKARRKEGVPLESLRRTAFLESWLRHLATKGVLTITSLHAGRTSSSSPETREGPTSGRLQSSVNWLRR